MPKREHRSNAEWQDIIERQEQSGLTGVAFCLQEGIYAKSFYRQRKLLGALVALALWGRFGRFGRFRFGVGPR